MDVRLTRLFIQSFRGIPGTLGLDFSPIPDHAPCSLILSGDNGTGKSSIVDAIEFALQARIGHGSKIRGGLAVLARSLAGAKLPEVQLTLSDGDLVIREIIQPYPEQKPYLKNRSLHPNFKISPFILRRADILNFIQTPDEKRQLIFLDYFRQLQQEIPEVVSAEEIAILNEKRLQQKNIRRELIKRLASKLNIQEEIIPLESKKFNDFIIEHVYGGLSRKKRKAAQRRGISVSPIRHDVESLIRDIRETFKNLSYLSGQLSKLNQAIPRSLNQEVLDPVLSNIGRRITESFRSLSRVDFVDKIELQCGHISKVSLSVKVCLKNGVECPPKQVFSEANLDLLALLIFLSVVKESSDMGQSKLLVLDDIFQSIDSTIRLTVTDYIMKEFSDWQLVFTVHDRLWQNQLRDIFRRYGHTFVEHEIVRWSFNEGPVILDSSHDMNSLLIQAIKHGQAYSVCSQAGLLLEAICSRLSWTLPISVIRRKDDKYTLGDLWPGCFKVLKSTNIKSIATEVDKWLHLRNLMGAHYNEWAISISSQEAIYFGEAVSCLFEAVKCKNCCRWVEKVSIKGKKWSCRCGKTTIQS